MSNWHCHSLRWQNASHARRGPRTGRAAHLSEWQPSFITCKVDFARQSFFVNVTPKRSAPPEQGHQRQKIARNWTTPFLMMVNTEFLSVWLSVRYSSYATPIDCVETARDSWLSPGVAPLSQFQTQIHCVALKLSAQRNETVLKLFCFSFIWAVEYDPGQAA